MSMLWPRWPLLLAALLTAGPSLAGEKLTPLSQSSLLQLRAREPSRVAESLALLKAERRDLGLKPEDDFKLAGAHTDRFGQTHAHFQQLHQGVPVWGAMAITHMSQAGFSLPVTKQGLRAGIRVGMRPTVDAASAISLATLELASRGLLGTEPKAELVIYPQTRRVKLADKPYAELNAADFSEEVTGYRLAWHVHTELDNPQDGIVHTDFLLDARTGTVLKRWNSLQTAAAVGKGLSQYSGEVQLDTWQLPDGTYELRDTTRSSGEGNRTYDVNHARVDLGLPATLYPYIDADNAWGDGNNYEDGGPTRNANGQTAAVDAHFGLQVTWDYFKKIHGRNGIDDRGTPTYNRVHVANLYDNAFWSGGCFCMSYGDGSYPEPGGAKSLNSLDVAAHELSHGVMSQTAQLIYAGESGGLNEANSDIFGTMTEFWVRNGRGNTIGDTGANWTMGEDLSDSPMRYMYKPSKDGVSVDAWYPGLASIDVHFSSGPMNRAFYFLSQGAKKKTDTPDDYASDFLPAGMTGIGNDKAAAIWYRAITVYLYPSANYNMARTASLEAAADLFGSQSNEYRAVQNAFAAINVGYTGGTYDDRTPPSAIASVSGNAPLLQLNATATDNVGVKRVEFYVDGILLGTDTSLPFSIPLDVSTLDNGQRELYVVAHDSAGNYTQSETFTFTVANRFSQLLQNPGFESDSQGWEEGPPGNINYPVDIARTGYGLSWLNGYGEAHMDNLHQDVTIPADAARTSLTFWMKLETEEPGTAARDTLVLQVRDTSGEVLETLATWSNLDATLGYVQRSFDLSAYAGQTIRVYLEGNEDAQNATSFYVDDFSLRVIDSRDAAPPSVVAHVTTSDSLVELSADVSDNGHVDAVEFILDGQSLGQSAGSFSKLVKLSTLANGLHTLVARATDAAGNTTDSSTVRFALDTTRSQLVRNPSFENYTTPIWSLATNRTGSIGFYSGFSHEGLIYILFRGDRGPGKSSLRQTVTIPANATSAIYSFWLSALSSAFSDGKAHDTFKVKVRDSAGTDLKTLATYSNLDSSDDYVPHRFDLSAYKGQTIQLYFESEFVAAQLPGGYSLFFLDDVELHVSSATDVQPPALTASVDGSYGTILLNATVSDNVWTSKLEFLVDGNPAAERVDPAAGTYQLPFDATSLSNGPHTLVVKAKDSVGNESQEEVAFTIANTRTDDTNAPTVNAVSVDARFELFKFQVDASDDTGIAHVEYYVDGAPVGRGYAPSYEFVYKAALLAEGQHTVKALAYDAYGHSGEGTTTFEFTQPYLTVSPARVVVAVGGTASFSVSVENAFDTSVSWAVKEGNTCGAITAAGAYSAATNPGVCHIGATSNAHKATSATATVIVYTGDLNGDGIVDGEDMGLMAQAYGNDSSQPAFDTTADLDADSSVSDNDVTLFVSQFGR
ncbi:M4 family metallopeptidase [Archangium violaceum]|uniref:M4 family metallopeptidase n=1 Tax=Archangium violaceum TaxID=83451 RepID=UPI001950D3C1|nr:M4 family metallopeptidase [Archangium violaceum]QRO01723.1 M4 family metallopeptidase [Archangium violaceum]